MKTKKHRTKAGDIFKIPIDQNRNSFGQVITNRNGVLRIVTFKTAYNIADKPKVENILADKIILLTDTMDALIYYGNWEIYDNEIPIKNLPMPNFKYGLDVVYITNYDHSAKRIATKQESDNLDFKFSFSPINIQNAMQAFFGLKEWDKRFDKLTFEYCMEKSQIKI